MFGMKNQQVQNAEENIRQLQEQVEKLKRHYDKQQDYIEGLYDVISDLTRQLGSALKPENMERLQHNPHLEDNSNFFLDLHALFSSRIKKGTNVTCFFGKDLPEIRRKFQDRDFKNHELAHMTERLTIQDLSTLLRDWMWKKPLAEGLRSIRKDKALDQL